MPIALNLNSQIAHIRRDKIITSGSPWGKGFAIGIMMAMVVMLPLFFVYSLTGPRMTIPASSRPGITLEQYASSPVPAAAPKDYLGS